MSKEELPGRLELHNTWQLQLDFPGDEISSSLTHTAPELSPNSAINLVCLLTFLLSEDWEKAGGH